MVESEEHFMCMWRDCNSESQPHPTERTFLSFFCKHHQENADDKERGWACTEKVLKDAQRQAEYYSKLMKIQNELIKHLYDELDKLRRGD